MSEQHGIVPETSWHCFGSRPLRELLGLEALPLTSAENAFRQLEYIEKYARDLDCKSIAIETPYIDRDYIEDHGAFSVSYTHLTLPTTPYV